MKKLIVSIVCAIATISAAFAGGDISMKDLEKAIDAKEVFLIDVNGTKSYAKGHIPTAIDFQANKDLSKVLPKDKDALIVAYCGGPNCSAHAMATKAAMKLGYTNVKHFTPGISGWKEADKPVEKG